MKDPKDERDELLRELYGKLKERKGTLVGVAVPWFTAESWARMRAVAADRDNLPVDFAEFERLARGRLADMIAKGHPAERVVMSVEDVEKLIALCRSASRPLDPPVRAAFAAFLLAQRDKNAGRA